MNKTTTAKAISLAGFLSTPGNGADMPSVLSVDDVFAEQQIRTDFDEAYILELAYRMYVTGQLQNIAVRPDIQRQNKYIIIFGENRWRAKLAMRTPEFAAYYEQMGGIQSNGPLDVTRSDKITAVVKAATHAQARNMQWDENIQRMALNKMEIARGLQQDIDAALEDGKPLTEAALAVSLGKTQAWVNEHLGLLRLGEVSKNAFMSGLTKDVTAANALGRIEKIDQEAAKAVVKTLKLDPKANARDVVGKTLKEVKTKAKGKTELQLDMAFPPRTNIKADASAAELACRMYARICGQRQSVADSHATLSDAEALTLSQWAKKHYAAGMLLRSSPAPRAIRAILDGFIGNRFSAGQDGAVAFAAWSLGAAGATFSLPGVLDEIEH